ncbi:MAG: tRNA 5-methoxyuridine(34)/uridine 5-oxyacetic acid(34) synthase CmoB [Victivallales bacterium]|nr:tRNA 5-methoxyuridine(34)/uridine 5-oxyacetic acid(34) synthase CmoB [Victivallales bacterium]
MSPDYTPFYTDAVNAGLPAPLAALLYDLARQFVAAGGHDHGDWSRWLAALNALPPPPAGTVRLDTDAVGIEFPLPDERQQPALTNTLQELHPWRKGPYRLGEIVIDTEWRSDRKWRRLRDHLRPLTGKKVLDIGGGNGYHVWRMAGAGAKLAVGIDPYAVFVMQYWAVRHFLGAYPAWVLPLRIEELPPDTAAFDTVFSMGVLYHRRDPRAHLAQLRGQLKPGGEVVVETLVIPGDAGDVLSPSGRYAKMRNIHAIPAPATLENWLRTAGFIRVRTVDVTVTTTAEQRTTPWMRWESLADYLDPHDPSRTVEGHPAPCRAIVLAERPA